MASSRPLDIIARFRTVTTDFNTREVEKELEDSDRAFDKSTRKAQGWSKGVKKATDDAGDAAKKGKGKFKEAGQEWGQNLAEGLRTGDIGGTVAETVSSLAGQFAGTGPIGAALGGLGLLAGGVFIKMQQDAAAAAAAAQSVFDQMIAGATDQAMRQTKLENAFGKGGLVENIAAAQAIADKMGTSLDEVVRYITEGDRGQQGLNRLQAEYAALLDKNVRQAGDLSNEDAVRLRALEDYLGIVDKASVAQGKAVQTQDKLAQLEGRSADAAERAAAARERDAEAAARLASSMKTAAYYAEKGSSYAVGGSTYNSQVPSAARRREP